MGCHIRRILIFLFIFVVVYLHPYILSESEEKGDAVDISQILEKTAQYCKRLDRISLHFVCNEEIKERIYYSQRFPSIFTGRTLFFRENTYVYDYQLIRQDNDITERRILVEENGEIKNEENAELKTQRFTHKYVIFGPVGLLCESQQQNHDYVINENEKFKGDQCFVIEAFPKSTVQADHLFGRAWVRQSDCSILKIEWNQESMGNIEGIEKFAEKLGAKPRTTFVSEYGYEKNGIRFPSKYFVKEEFLHPRRGKLKVSETTVVYKDYKFFIVETEVKIK